MGRELKNDCEMLVANRLKSLRKKLNASQNLMAKHLNMPQSNYSMYENGKLPISINTLSRICETFNIDMKEFLASDNNITKE